jgi:Flp pilus assembly pilin Flp
VIVLNQLQNKWLYGQVAVIEQARLLARTVRDRALRATRDERGQTPTEYLMIVGLMAAVIVMVFVTFYWAQVKTAANDWVDKVKKAILGTDIS